MLKNSNIVKRQFIFILLLFSAAAVLSAQSLSQPGAKELHEKSFSKAEKKILKAYEGDSSDAMNCYMVALLYGDSQNPHADNERAWLALQRTKGLLGSLSNLQLGLLKRDGLTLDTVEKQLVALTLRGLEKARKANTKEAYSHFVEFYAATISDSIRAVSRAGVSDIDFEAAVAENTVEGYEHFIANHPGSAHLFDAERRMHALAFARSKSMNTLSAYERFIADYPDADEADEAELQVYAIMYYRALSQNTVEAFRKYAADYPDSPYSKNAKRKADALCFSAETDVSDWISFKRFIENHSEDVRRVEEAKRIIAEISIEDKNADGLLWCLDNCDSSMTDTILSAIHDLYVNSDRVADFDAQYEHIMQGWMLQKDQEALAAIRSVEVRNWESVSNAVREIAPYRIAYDLLINMIENSVALKRWETAGRTVSQFADFFEDNADYKALRALLAAPKVDIDIVKLDPNVSSKTGDELFPVIAADEQTIYFAGRNRHGSIGGMDIFMSTRTASGQWRRSFTVPGLNSVGRDELPLSLSRDGQTMVLSQNGLLKISRLTADGWSMPEQLPEQLRIGTWQGDAMLASDGRTILFSAKKKTPHEVVASDNIFVSTLDDNGHWSEPVSLGTAINTFGSDRAPYLHADMKTLYFASNRHSNIGGYDIFMSTRLSETSWTEWSEPVNIGKEINTAGDDCWFVVNTAGNKAYIPVKDSTGWDICEFAMPQAIRPRTVATLTGTVCGPDGRPLKAKLRWFDLHSGDLCGIYNTSAADGSFNIALPLGHEYGYYVDNPALFPVSAIVDLRTTTISKMEHHRFVTADTNWAMCDSLSVELPLDGLVFNSSKPQLSPLSRFELKRVAEWLKTHTKKTTLTVYTDAQSAAMKNSLDHQRVAALKKALINEGCAGSQIDTEVKAYARGQSISDRHHRQHSVITIKF